MKITLYGIFRFLSGFVNQINSCYYERNTEHLPGIEWQGVIAGGLAKFEKFTNDARAKYKDQKSAKDETWLLPLFEFPIQVKQDAKRNEITNGLIKLRRVARSRVVVANGFIVGPITDHDKRAAEQPCINPLTIAVTLEGTPR